MAKKIYMFAFCLLFSILGVITISASATLTKTGQLTFRNIKLVVKDSVASAGAVKLGANDTAAEASDLEPFIYEDRVYVPISAVAEALGKDIVWDDETSTVTIKAKALSDSDMEIVSLQKEVRVQLKPGADGKEYYVLMNFALELTDAKYAELISEKETTITNIAEKMIENLDYETITQENILASVESYMQSTSNQILGGDYVSRVFVTDFIIQ